jgi:hypothetical protein
MLRWLLLLPGGDREKGLARILEARDRGELLTGEADYQLHFLYLWYERQPAVALELLEKLAARYPTNPVFLQRVAELHDVYRHDPTASANAWRLLLERAQRRDVYAPEIAAVRAHLGLASQFALMERTDDAIEQLRIVIAQRPQAPAGALTRAETTLRALSKQSGR